MSTRHLNALEQLHTAPELADGSTMHAELRRIERRANRAACAACNHQRGVDAWPQAQDLARAKVALVFGGTLPPGFFVNGDPRGYTLKLDDGQVPDGIQKDWGGYGCLAIEFEGVQS